MGGACGRVGALASSHLLLFGLVRMQHEHARVVEYAPELMCFREQPHLARGPLGYALESFVVQVALDL